MGIQPDFLSDLVIEGINNIPVLELEKVYSHALQEECMGSFEMPWLEHMPSDLKMIASDYFEQFYDGINGEWLDDPV